jgi:hypothetical protein
MMDWAVLPGWIALFVLAPVLLVGLYLLVAWAIVDSPWRKKS